MRFIFGDFRGKNTNFFSYSYWFYKPWTPHHWMVISNSVPLKDLVCFQYHESAISAWKVELGICFSWTQNCAFWHVISTTACQVPWKTPKINHFCWSAMYLLCGLMLSDEIIASTCTLYYQLFGGSYLAVVDIPNHCQDCNLLPPQIFLRLFITPKMFIL